MAAVSDNGTVSNTIVTQGSAPTATTSTAVNPLLRRYATAYETAKFNYNYAKAIVVGHGRMLTAIAGRTTISKIVNYTIEDGRTYLTLEGSNFPRNNNRTLNGWHHVLGLPKHPTNGTSNNGLFDSDFRVDSTSPMTVSYKQDRTDTNKIITVKGATVRSCAANGKATSRIAVDKPTVTYGEYIVPELKKYNITVGSNWDVWSRLKDIMYASNDKYNNDGPLGNGVSTGVALIGSTDWDNVRMWYRFNNQHNYFKNVYLPATKDAFNKKKAAYKAAAKSLKLPDPFTGQSNNNNNNNGGTPPAPKDDKGTTNPGDDTKPVIYNLPGTKESYFTANNAAMFVSEGNTPQKVAQASDLWAKANTGGHKGMIQSYLVPSKLKGTNWFKPEDIAGSANNREINSRRYGFQFLYNPSTVEMAYAGAPQVDIGLQISGQDKVPLIGAGVTSSTLSFQLLLNRMPDMSRLGQSRTWSEDGKNLTIGIDKDARNYYPWQLPDTAAGDGDARTMSSELALIAEMGTMYDVEYLLRTLLGYGLKSEMRGNKITADIGYLGAYPVELHLGRNLRYLVTIDSFNLNHTIFTKDMVPVFTNLSITCNRLPDFGKKIGTDIKTNITST